MIGPIDILTATRIYVLNHNDPIPPNTRIIHEEGFIRVAIQPLDTQEDYHESQQTSNHSGADEGESGVSPSTGFWSQLGQGGGRHLH